MSSSLGVSSFISADRANLAGLKMSEYVSGIQFSEGCREWHHGILKVCEVVVVMTGLIRILS